MYLFFFISVYIKISSIESKVNTSFRSLRKLTYSSSGGSGGSGPSNSTDYYTSVEDSPRSPKIIYSAAPDTHDCNVDNLNDDDNIESFKLTNNIGKNVDNNKCVRKYSSDSEYSTPLDLSAKTSNRFVFDAVSPLRESTGNGIIFYFLVNFSIESSFSVFFKKKKGFPVLFSFFGSFISIIICHIIRLELDACYTYKISHPIGGQCSAQLYFALALKKSFHFRFGRFFFFRYGSLYNGD